jgi:hypothetical protein
VNKKEAKKTLIPIGVTGTVAHRPEGEQKFFASFFQKRSSYFFCSLNNPVSSLLYRCLEGRKRAWLPVTIGGPFILEFAR